MFIVLSAGIYSAYKHFSGFDPLKLNPQSVFLGIMNKNEDVKRIVSQIPGFKENLTSNIQPKNSVSNLQLPTSKPVFSFLLIADSHNDSSNLQKAIFQASMVNPDLAFIIGLGDYTDVGTLDELKIAKAEFDRAGLRYFLAVGDHDLWDSRDKNKEAKTNFKEVFGSSYQSFNYEGYLFMLLDNSDNYLGLNNIQLEWINTELEKGKNEVVKGIFVFISTPLYHPSSDHYMGKIDKELKEQAQSLIYRFKDSGVNKVFSGDVHYFSEYEEPITKLSMVTVGAVSSDRNPQAPRYAIVTVFEDGSTRVDDVEIR